MGTISIRGVPLFVDVVGKGRPLLLMHGGPGLDHFSLLPLRRLADRFTLVFYDHRCNGRSVGAPVESMTWENLTADAEALRERLGFERWAVLGHSFGGHVALEYALRYPDRLSHLVLMDTGADGRWPRDKAPGIVAGRGYGPQSVRAVRRVFRGQIEPNEMTVAMMRFLTAYYHRQGLSLLWLLAREMLTGAWHAKTRAEPLIYAGRELMKSWSVMDRLGEIKVPTMVIAGRDDFLFPPEHQVQLAAGIPNARLRIIERAGHNPQSERPDEVMAAISEFMIPIAGRNPSLRARGSGVNAPTPIAGVQSQAHMMATDRLTIG